jgi:hypothetical protein
MTEKTLEGIAPLSAIAMIHSWDAARTLLGRNQPQSDANKQV